MRADVAAYLAALEQLLDRLRMLSTRGTQIFSPAELDRIVQETVVPEVGAGHSLAVVAATSATGVSAALVFRRASMAGTWNVEAAVTHTWAGDNQVGAKVVWSV